MPTVEGFTPDVLWTTVYGMLALCILFMVVFKVYDAIHTIIERHRQKKESETPDFAEKISRQVVAEITNQLEPRLAEIERNLERDKRRLENHEMLITEVTESQRNLHDGVVAMCKFMLVLSNYGNLGNNEKIKEATADLTKYLAEQM